MAEFIALSHGPLLLQASVTAAATRLAFQLWKRMETNELEMLSTINEVAEPVIARATKTSLMRHLWYLTQELVVLGLFDLQVRDEDNARMVQTLANSPRAETYSSERPAFPLQPVV